MKPEDIKKLRSKLGWSQEKLGRELGVSFCTINRWEAGKSEPKLIALKALEKLKNKIEPSKTRNSIRIDVNYPITVQRAYPNGDNKKTADFNTQVFTSSTCNLSVGGLMFSAPFILQKGEFLCLDLNLSEGSVRTVSEVVWVNENDNHLYVGVRFHKFLPQDLIKIMNGIISNI